MLALLSDASASKELGTVVALQPAGVLLGCESCVKVLTTSSVSGSALLTISRRKVLTLLVLSSGSNTHAPRTSPVAMAIGCGRLNAEQVKLVLVALFNSASSSVADFCIVIGEETTVNTVSFALVLAGLYTATVVKYSLATGTVNGGRWKQ